MTTFRKLVSVCLGLENFHIALDILKNLKQQQFTRHLKCILGKKLTFFILTDRFKQFPILQYCITILLNSSYNTRSDWTACVVEVTVAL